MNEQGRKILVAEDSGFWRELLSEALGEAGYQVRTCEDGLQAITQLDEFTPDFLITDYHLPQIDGERLCAYCRSRPELGGTVPVVLSGALVSSDGVLEIPDAAALVSKGQAQDTLAKLLKILSDLEAGGGNLTPAEDIAEPLPMRPQVLASKLAQLKEFVDLLHKDLLEAIFEIDADRRLIRLNPRAELMVRQPEHAVLGQDVLAVLELGRDSALGAAIDAALSGGSGHGPAVAEHEHGGRMLETTISRLVRGRARPGAILISRDQTARRAAETALEETEAQLLHAQKMEAIGRLAGGVAHDFNNLLSSITGYVELLLANPGLDEQTKADLQQVYLASDRAKDLTRQLLAFARRQVIQPRIVDLNNLIRSMEKMLGRLIGENIELVTVLSDGLGRVKVDPGQIEQIVMNLAVNARDAMPDGGKLVLVTSNIALDQPVARFSWCVEPGPYVTLMVTDTGCGIDAETQAHVFEPFFTTKEEGKGSGLGLSTVYGIVKQSGGDITVDSTTGEGTTFTIYLPRCEELPAATGELEPAGRAQLGGSETILVAEDDTQLLELMTRTLEARGYRVIPAADGREAMSVGREPVDLLVTDVVMPRMGGQELAELLSANQPRARVLFISGYAETGKSGVQEAMPEPLLTKPFSPVELLAKIRDVLDNGRGPQRPGAPAPA